MSASFQLDFQVRDYELDQFGVVNNAVYLNYLEHTRHVFLLKIGMDTAQIASNNQSLALSEIHLQFHQSLRAHQTFSVHLQISKLRRTSLVISQQITRPAATPSQPPEPILSAAATAVFLNQQAKPTRLTHELQQRLQPYISS